MTRHDSTIEIGGLAGLDLAALRQRWRELHHSEPPLRMSRELLIQAIAYRIQEIALGGLSRAARTKLAGSSAELANTAKPRAITRCRIKAGTRFLREWQGRTHEVIATEDGRFRYAGASYRSLSQIARQITGTRWSGPAFFGLKPSLVRAHAAG